MDEALESSGKVSSVREDGRMMTTLSLPPFTLHRPVRQMIEPFNSVAWAGPLVRPTFSVNQ